MDPTETYQVYAIKYAHHDRLSISNFMDPPDIHDGKMPIDFFIWLAHSKNHTFVIDTGFNRETAASRQRELLRCPTEGLKLLNVDSKKIKNVVITHLHYDHVGNFDLFPKAQFHIQDKEMAFATGRNMRYKPFQSPMDIEHIIGMGRNVYAGRVEFHEGSAKLAPGFELHHIGGHTAGLQCVRILTIRGWIVLASDASHLYANMEKVNPYPIIYREDEMLAGFEKLKQLATSNDHIIPGHDPLVMERYPAPHEELQGIIARLDQIGPSYE